MLIIRVIIKLCTFESPGIFAYLNYLTPKSRKEILELLVVGLKRLEYRGYDSAGKIISLTVKVFSHVKLYMLAKSEGKNKAS